MATTIAHLAWYGHLCGCYLLQQKPGAMGRGRGRGRGETCQQVWDEGMEALTQAAACEQSEGKEGGGGGRGGGSSQDGNGDTALSEPARESGSTLGMGQKKRGLHSNLVAPHQSLLPKAGSPRWSAFSVAKPLLSP